MVSKSIVRRRFGWRPDTPDIRDYRYAAPRRKLPSSIDMRPNCPPVADQGSLGSCTAFAIAAAYQFCLRKQRAPAFDPSRLFLYYNERVLEGTVSWDSGAELRNGFKTLAREGLCATRTWPYKVARYRDKPPAPAYAEGLSHQSLVYRRVGQSLSQLKGCLASGAFVTFGFAVYESFESSTVSRTGTVPMPKREEVMVGGHAVDLVGYDDRTQRFWVLNSWGASWGNKGFFTLPYAYVTNPDLAADFWMLELVE